MDHVDNETILNDINSDDSKPDVIEEQSVGQEPSQGDAYAYKFKSDDDLLKHTLKYKASGKDLEEPLDTILKRAQMGYDYAQRMAAFKNEQEAFAKEREGFQGQLDATKGLEKFAEWQKYAESNPAWYDHWMQAWDSRDAGLPNQPNQPEVDIESRIAKMLDERLKPIDAYAKQIEQDKVRNEQQAEDRKLESEVRSIREKYSDIDFDTTDPETGKSLEFAVLEFQIQNGLNSFDQAFKAFYHDKLVDRAVTREKEQLLKEHQKNAKAGIVKDRFTSPTFDVSKSSYDQLSEHALKFLNKQT